MSHYDVQVSLIDNSVLKVNNKDLGLKTFPYLYLSTELSNGKESSVKKFLALYSKGSDVVSINIYTPAFVLSKNGREEKPAKLLRTIHLLDKPY